MTAIAASYLDSLPDRIVREQATLEELRRAFVRPLPARGSAALDVIESLVRRAEPGLVTSAGPRYFGFVTGGSFPAAVAADWLASAWDQNVGLYVQSPALAVIEEACAAWLLDLFGLPATASVGFVTGCHMANFTALAAARHEVLRRAGWDVETRGLQGAPRVAVVVGDEVHVSVVGALRLTGFGSAQLYRVPVDGQGQMRTEELTRTLDTLEGPVIVCAQAGNVNTGGFDSIDRIARETRKRGAWLHVDGAFGMWAATVPSLAHHMVGVALADSWATDAHKWLNVPYDSGIVCVAHPDAHRAAMSLTASYLDRGTGRNGMDWSPESSRRARILPLYATLMSLGRDGVASLVERCCALAARFSDRLRRDARVQILNNVVLNQVLVRFKPQGGGDADVTTRDVVARVQQDGTCWLGGTTWRGLGAMRISVCNWSTTESDVDRSAEAILRALGEATS